MEGEELRRSQRLASKNKQKKRFQRVVLADFSAEKDANERELNLKDQFKQGSLFQLILQGFQKAKL